MIVSISAKGGRMKRRYWITWVVLLIMPLLIFCCSYSPRKDSAKFQPGEYKPYESPGTASISGQAVVTLEPFVTTIPAKACRIFLHPVTTYSKGWFERIFLGEDDHKLPPYEDQLDSKYTKTCVTDNFGRFKFEWLPPGEYYLFTVISWDEKILVFNKKAHKPLWTIVKVSEGENKETILTAWVRKTP
jgi:hypothetical protein